MRIGINGFGRIGRGLFRKLEDNPCCHVVAVNDLSSAEDLVHYLRHDSLVGNWTRNLQITAQGFAVQGREVSVFNCEDRSRIPWREVGVELVIEATRSWHSRSDLNAHLRTDSDRVIVAANCPEADVAVIPGINDAALNSAHRIISAASCTTQCLAAILKPLLKVLKMEAVDYTVIHPAASDQVLVDSVGRGPRKGRSALSSAIPIPTTASVGIERLFPDLIGRISGIVVRVPIAAVSLVFITLIPAERGVTWSLESIHDLLKTTQSRTLRVTNDPLVSIDYISETTSAVVDLTLTRSDSRGFITLGAWFDNEAGHVSRLSELVELVAEA